jgi:hypothetical protein
MYIPTAPQPIVQPQAVYPHVGEVRDKEDNEGPQVVQDQVVQQYQKNCISYYEH